MEKLLIAVVVATLLAIPARAQLLATTPIAISARAAESSASLPLDSLSDIPAVAPSTESDSLPGDSPPGGSSVDAPPSAAPQETGRPPERVQWKSLILASNFYLGVMHAHRIAYEPGTRDALHNSVFGGYFTALGSMHGWSDGDGYYENYLGHPMEGSVAGFIWIQNDPRYRNTSFGSSRDYWMSRLRAYAFTWTFSEQFEIGPVSEATIGQIQRYCCAYGFVDHVITPNLGLGWLVGEDILDKYLIRTIENHSANRWVRIGVRSALNPTRSFANMMTWKAPWHRNDRPGILDYDGESYVRAEPVAQWGDRPASLVPRFELTATLPSVLRTGNLSCIGGGGIGAFRLTDSLQWTAEVSGCNLQPDLPKNWSGDSLTFTTGPQWILHSASRWSPHLHARIGGQKVTEQYEDPVLKKKVLAAVPPGGDPNLVYYDYVTPYERTGLSIAVGGGLDMRVNRISAVRVASLDYVRSWLGELNGVNFDHGFRFSTGVVLRVGTW